MNSRSSANRAVVVLLVLSCICSVKAKQPEQSVEFSQDPEYGFPLRVNMTFLTNYPQKFPMTLDTGSQGIWVQAQTEVCRDTFSWSTESCKLPPGLHIDASLTRDGTQWSEEMEYRGKFNMHGNWYKGIIKLTDRLQVNNQFFVANSIHYPGTSPHRGVLGLSMGSIRDCMDSTRCVWDALYREHKFRPAAFSLVVYPQAAAAELGQGGIISFGPPTRQLNLTSAWFKTKLLVLRRPVPYRKRDTHIETRKDPEEDYYPMNTWWHGRNYLLQYWLKGGGFVVGNGDGTNSTTGFEDKFSARVLEKGKNTVPPWLLDTGNPYIAIRDHAAVRKIWDGFQPKGKVIENELHVACNATPPTLVIPLGGTWNSPKTCSWPLKPETLIMTRPDGKCIAAVVKSWDHTTLGLPFFRNVVVNHNIEDGFMEFAQYELPRKRLDVQGWTFTSVDGRLVQN